MISKVAVFHRGGAVLWRSDDEKNNNNETQTDTPTAGGETNDSYLSINKLIQTILLSDKTASDSMIYDSYTLKWTFANNLDLVFVAVYFSFQKLLYVDDFLQTIKNEFISLFNDTLSGGILNLTSSNYKEFYLKYKRIQKYYKTQYKSSKLNAPKQWHETKQGQKQQQYSYNHKKNNKKEDSKSPTKPSGPRPFNPNKKKNKSKSQRNINKKNQKKNKKKLKKEHWSANNVYNFNKKKVSKQEMDTLNFALENDSSEKDIIEEEEVVYDTPSGDANLESSDEESSDDDYSDLLIHNNTNNNNNTNSNSSGYNIWNKFSKLIGNKPIEESDLIQILSDLERQLSSKNVANSIAKELCDSLRAQLIGKRIGTFESIKSFVKTKLIESLERILQPEIDINILSEISRARSENRTYSIVFIGVNGVGKSTSLSKVIYYLKSRNLRVSVAACDTFRSGAVEQLKTHCKALKVRLFNQGYARDAGSVAMRAIKEANNKFNDDVLLIDTAGRMQNNAPLMKSLVSLITRNKPDLILFVGEALVGNDGVDQLLEFNKALMIQNNKHLIDGIILTKFDTVDDKVGAAISMTYKSRKPIIFIGTGQHYTDLKRMHVKTLINKLLQ